MRPITPIIIVLCLFAAGLSGCANRNEAYIRKAVTAFHNRPDRDFTTMDRSLLSRSLSLLIDSAKARQDKEEQLVLASPHPDEKPLLIEGDIFSSTYEGTAGAALTIDTILVQGKEAMVAVSYTDTVLKASWQDELVLVQENGWKIDDVRYKTIAGGPATTQTLLREFIYAPPQ